MLSLEQLKKVERRITEIMRVFGEGCRTKFTFTMSRNHNKRWTKFRAGTRSTGHLNSFFVDWSTGDIGFWAWGHGDGFDASLAIRDYADHEHTQLIGEVNPYALTFPPVVQTPEASVQQLTLFGGA